MKEQKTIVYEDLHNDDFAGTDINQKKVDGTFPYRHASPFWNAAAWLLYYFVAFPIVFLTAKLYLGLRFENKKALKNVGKGGFFLYGNHTRDLDAFVPALAVFPRRADVIANPDAVSMRGLRNIVQMLGCIPVPNEMSGYRPFCEAVDRSVGRGSCVAIYPEAHVWPFYTGVRPFPDVSFSYPVKSGAPAVAMATTYRKRRGLFALCKKPGMTVTFSEVMRPDPSLPPRQAQKDLRDRVYAFMKAETGRAGNVEYIRYIAKEDAEKEG